MRSDTSAGCVIGGAHEGFQPSEAPTPEVFLKARKAARDFRGQFDGFFRRGGRVGIKNFFFREMRAGASMMRSCKMQDDVAFDIAQTGESGDVGCVVERAEFVAVVLGDVARAHSGGGFGENGFRLGVVVVGDSKVGAKAEIALPLRAILAGVVQGGGKDKAAT